MTAYNVAVRVKQGLLEAGLKESHVDAFLNAILDILNERDEDLVKKQDMVLLRAEFKDEISVLRTDIIRWTITQGIAIILIILSVLPIMKL